MICEHFRATVAYEAVHGPRFVRHTCLQNLHDFDVPWNLALLSASEVPTEMVQEGLYKSKLQDSVQLQTVLARHEHKRIFETLDNRAVPD